MYLAVGPTSVAVDAADSASLARALTSAEEQALQPKEEFQECANCPRMVAIPSGDFMMGTDAGDTAALIKEYGRKSEQYLKRENPQHRVVIPRPFAVGKYVVTFAEWDECVADGGCGGYQPDDAGCGRGNIPVINVSWDDAKAYAAWLSKKTGKTYRLLSEAEWEYVARAGTTTPFWWGSSITPDQANYNSNAVYKGSEKREPRRSRMSIHSFQPNPWGLYQVHGNVWEWAEDCSSDNYDGAPTDGSALTTGECRWRVLRGGSWKYGPHILRAAYRHRNCPSIRYSDVGFRLARTF